MKMMMIVTREALESEVVEIIQKCDVLGYTILPQAHGAGEKGVVAASRFSHGPNVVIFAVIDDDRADLVTKVFKAFIAERVAMRKEHVPSLRMFLLPCEQII